MREVRHGCVAAMCGLAAGSWATPGVAAAAQYKFITLDPPGFNESEGEAINDAGQVVVMVGSIQLDGGGIIFIWKDGRFTLMKTPPDRGPFIATSISPWGLVVGLEFLQFGFAYSTIQEKLYSLNIRHQDTGPYAINAHGQVTGYTNFYQPHAFIYQYGDYTILNPPGSTYSVGNWINDSGQVVGYSQAVLNGPSIGFSYRDGQYSTVAVPGARNTEPLFVSANGDISGSYRGTVQHGFVFSRGVYATVDGPDAYQTSIVAVNGRGEAIGNYRSAATSYYRHIFRSAGGVTSQAEPPGSFEAFVPPGGLNNAGWFVGTYYTDSTPHEHAFVAVCNPP